MFVASALLQTTSAVAVVVPSAAIDSTDPVPSDVQGTAHLTSNYTLDWHVQDASAANQGTITFTLTWDAAHDWAAIGLRSTPVGTSMADAEVFMCASTNTGVHFCQVRNTKAGFVTPALDSNQYLTMVQGGRNATTA